MRRAVPHASAPPYRASSPSFPHWLLLPLLLLVACAGIAHAVERSTESCIDGACTPVTDTARAPLPPASLSSPLSAPTAPQSPPAPSVSDSTQSSSPPAPVPEASGATNETSLSEEDTPFDTIASLFAGPVIGEQAEKSPEPTNNRTCAAVIERDERFALRGIVLELEDEQQIEEIISGAKGHPWLHVFLLYASACPFSDLMQAEADRLAAALPEAVVFKMRHDHIHYLFTSGSFGVALYPTTLIYRSGDLIGRIEGLKHAPLLAAALAEYSVAWPAIPYEPEEEHAAWKIEGDYFTDDRLVWAAIAGLAFSVLYFVAERRGYFEPAAPAQAMAQAQAVPNAAAPVPG